MTCAIAQTVASAPTIPFSLPKETDWGKEPGTRFAGTAQPSRPVRPAPELVSASSVASPAYQEMAGKWQQPGPSVVLDHKQQLLQVKQLYSFRRPEEVISFLDAYPFLLPLLMGIYDKVVECFGPYPHVVLEVVNDLEVRNHRELFVLVQTGLSPSEALACLERFDQEWWLDISASARCLLNVDVEYV